VNSGGRGKKVLRNEGEAEIRVLAFTNTGKI
jgi:hypothetical protein